MIRKNFLPALLTLISAQVASVQQTGFDVREFYQSTDVHNIVGAGFGPNGSLTFSPMESTDFGNCFTLFDHSLIKNEFELMGEQSADYDRVIAEWKKKLIELSKREQEMRTGPINLSGDSSERRERNSIAVHSLAELDGVLLPHQKGRINQIQIRMVFLLETKPLFENRNFLAAADIGPAELGAARNGVPDLIASIKTESIKIRDDTLEKLSSSLPGKARRAFHELWSAERYEGDPQLVLLSMQLNNEIQLSPDCPGGQYEVIWQTCAFPYLNMKVNGYLKPFYLNRFKPILLFYQLHSLLNSPLVVERLDLDPQTAARVWLVLESYSTALEPAANQLRQRHKEGWKEDEAKAEYERASNKVYETLVDDIREVLSEKGWSELEKIAREMTTRCHGPLYDLLSEERGYTGEKRARIEEDGKKAYEELVKRAKELEEKAINDFVELFDDESTRRLKEMFGAPISSTKVQLDILLMQLGMLTAQ